MTTAFSMDYSEHHEMYPKIKVQMFEASEKLF